MKDKNGSELVKSSIINIHQTVNGENIFVILDVKDLDLRYGFDLDYKYQYDVSELLAPNKFNGEVEWEIIGNLHQIINNLRP